MIAHHRQAHAIRGGNCVLRVFLRFISIPGLKTVCVRVCSCLSNHLTDRFMQTEASGRWHKENLPLVQTAEEGEYCKDTSYNYQACSTCGSHDLCSSAFMNCIIASADLRIVPNLCVTGHSQICDERYCYDVSDMPQAIVRLSTVRVVS